MKIEYLGHSCFKLTSKSGIAVVCDPYDSSIGYKMPQVTADIATASHHHYDHDNVKAVSGNPVFIDYMIDGVVSGIKISSVKSYHDTVRGKARGENIIYKFEIDGLTICHLGDLGEDFSQDLSNRIAPVDILLTPVGGNYTIDAKTAKKYVDAIEPDIVVPMHYSVEGGKIDIDGVQNFLSLFGKDRIEKLNGSVLDTDVMLNVESKKVVLLERRK